MAETDNRTSQVPASLHERSPEMTAAWKGTELLRMYEQNRQYSLSDPTHCEKPEVVRSLEHHLGEMAGTVTALQVLALRAYNEAYPSPEDDVGSEGRALYVDISLLHTQLPLMQLAIENLAAVAELKALDKSQPGGFSHLPGPWRRKMTESGALTSENRFAKVKNAASDPKSMQELQGDILGRVEQMMVTLDDVERRMKDQGVLVEPRSDSAKLQAQRDHDACLEYLIPHLRAHFAAANRDLTRLVAIADDSRAAFTQVDAVQAAATGGERERRGADIRAQRLMRRQDDPEGPPRH